jgi:hypothetical protein
MAGDENGLALVLSGCGARAADQVGFLRCLSRNFPDLNIPFDPIIRFGSKNTRFVVCATSGLIYNTGAMAEKYKLPEMRRPPC